MKNTKKNISIEKLHPFENHPYKVQDDEEMEHLAESICENGIVTPVIVRQLENTTDEYEIISGHRRVMASRKAGITEIPALVVSLDRDAAAIVLVDSNLHREHILPSEKAFAYKMKLDAMKHQGWRSDLTSGQIVPKSDNNRTTAKIGEDVGESYKTVQRYIRLTYLIPEFLEQMDEGRIAFSVGVELSYLNEQAQYDVLEQCEMNDCTPSYSQAFRLHKFDRDGMLTKAVIQSVMSEEKANQKEKVSFKYEEIKRFFPKNYTLADIQKSIMKLIEADHMRRQRKRSERDER